MVLLSDAEGFLLEVVGNNELLPVGICCQESVIGQLHWHGPDRRQIHGNKDFRTLQTLPPFYNSVGVPIKADSHYWGAEFDECLS